ncbi:glycosyltransferase family 39 protein [Kallotenue papyrolyticum]|uniref:glycosyltransferase family 39 protein n=1 Tax=Kallotenue papyrolyticum TaxID=1325125 RepID=UPI0004785385|nr:glycosyltransferase family 39 protein [Kallotenue papyrolyticum]
MALQEVVAMVRRGTWRTPGWRLVLGMLCWLAALAAFSGDVLAWGVGQSLAGLGLALALTALYLVPGLAVLCLTRGLAGMAWAERASLAFAVGIACPPLLLEVAYLLGLPWNRAATIGYVLLAALVLVMWARSRTWQAGLCRPAPVDALLGGVVLVAALVRLYVVRDLPVGLWGDSYQHTMMTQLLVDKRGLFTSWQPYAPLTTFTYHYGFHANAAFLHWLTGLPVRRSVVIVGQVFNVAALTGVYLLAARLTGKRWAGVWAAALIGFYNTQPAYYVNWGRYTQLTGQVLLPAVILAWITLLEQDRFDMRGSLLAALLTAGLMLTHYIVTIFGVVLVGSYLLLRLARVEHGSQFWRRVGRIAPALALALLLALPWLLNTLDGYLVRNTAGFVQQRVDPSRIENAARLRALPPFFIKGPLLALAALGALLAWRRRSWQALVPGVWTLGLLLLMTPQVVGLPGAGVIDWFAVYIALYLTLGPLAGYALALLQHRLAQGWPHATLALATLMLIALSVWGVRWQRQIVDAQYQLVTPADMAAMEWIRANTPPDALFHVNMFPAYGGTLFAGSDAGWWIPLLTGRASTLPPLTYGSERGETPDYYRQVNDFGYALREHRLPSEEAIRLLRERGVQYIYSGAHRGQDDPIDVAALRAHPAFEVVYEREGVVIVRLRGE